MRALGLSTLAFTICFAVWTIFSIIGVPLRAELNLSETQFGLLVGTPVLTGSLVRVALGIWTDRHGGRLVFPLTMLAAALATALLAFARNYEHLLLAALGVGLAGGAFAVGVAYVARFYPAGRQGAALGIFGIGNVGSALTMLLAPPVMLAWGWQAVALVWAGALALMAFCFRIFAEDDPHTRRRIAGQTTRSLGSEFAPLANPQVWRFALYYACTFGGFVALTLWLPRYLVGVYGFDIATAGLLAAAYAVPASLFRAYGGALADRMGARMILYWALAVSALITLVLAISPGVGTWLFAALVFVLGAFMSLGMAAVFKHIPVYYPDHVGAVGGLVGMIGGLGGFALPLAFGVLNDFTGAWTSCFAALFVLASLSLLWMHTAVRRLGRRAPAHPA